MNYDPPTSWKTNTEYAQTSNLFPIMIYVIHFGNRQQRIEYRPIGAIKSHDKNSYSLERRCSYPKKETLKNIISDDDRSSLSLAVFV